MEDLTGRRCVIVGGAPISDYGWLRQQLRAEDYVICCDSGLLHRQQLGLTPDLVVGDFDSCDDPHLPVETITLPRAKDDTDTVYGIRTALERGCRDFVLVGVTGARLDHTLGNLAALLFLDRRGASGVILDDLCRISLVTPERPAEIAGCWPFFSLVAVGGPAEGVIIENALFPLDRGTIGCDYQYGVSNQVLPGKTARVRLEQGALILLCDRK